MDKQVKISLTSHQTLTTLAAKKDRSLKDFLEQCIQYFKITELDPKEIDADGIRVEIKKLDRRVVSFFKTQEKEKIAPILDELSIISKGITQSLAVAPTKKDFTGLSAIVTDHIKKLIDSHNSIFKSLSEVRTKEILESKQKARKLFREYLTEVENKGALASKRTIDEKYIKAFDAI